MLVVDDKQNVLALQEAARHSGLQVIVLIDLDVGQNRTGVAPENQRAPLLLRSAAVRISNSQVSALTPVISPTSQIWRTAPVLQKKPGTWHSKPVTGFVRTATIFES